MPDTLSILETFPQEHRDIFMAMLKHIAQRRDYSVIDIPLDEQHMLLIPMRESRHGIPLDDSTPQLRVMREKFDREDSLVDLD